MYVMTETDTQNNKLVIDTVIVFATPHVLMPVNGGVSLVEGMYLHPNPNSRGARVQILEVVDTSCYFWLPCILLNFKPSRKIFQRATLSNQCT